MGGDRKKNGYTCECDVSGKEGGGGGRDISGRSEAQDALVERELYRVSASRLSQVIRCENGHPSREDSRFGRDKGALCAFKVAPKHLVVQL